MASVKQLTSRNNPLLKKIRLMNSGVQRDPEGLVVAEGIRILEEATASGCTMESAVFTERFIADPRGKSLFEKWQKLGIALFQVGENIFQALSDLQAPQGAIALVHIPEKTVPPEPNSGALILYACGIQDPGNLGTLIRTAAASGATFLCTSPGTVSARNPKVIRSSAGAYFRHVPVEHMEPGAFLHYCRKGSIRVYRTDVSEGIPYTATDLKCSCAILLGNEGRGMNKKEFQALPAVHIPMANNIESLNVALAGAVLLFEAARQRSVR